MIQLLYLSEDGEVRMSHEQAELPALLQDGRGRLWVDIAKENSERWEPILQDQFGFHPLAVKDALEESHVPKVDDWGDYLYTVIHAAKSLEPAGEGLPTVELDAFLGRNYLVTYHQEPVAGLERVWEIARRENRLMSRGVAYVLYRIMDEIVDDYMPFLENIEGKIDVVEDQVFANPRPVVLETLFTCKRILLYLRRMFLPQRELLNKLARGDYAAIPTEQRIYFRDVYDHYVRLHDYSESLRDLVGSALETYLSVVNNRMNEVMKVLTVITTLFMPLSFLVGFFGMNFFQPSVPFPDWTGKLAFGLLLTACLVAPAGMYFWMRRKAFL